MFKIIIAFVIFSTTSFAQTAMISHKGIWKDMLLPQNTKESLLRAFEHGFDGIEFDTYKTVDDVFILAHDDSLDKVTTCTGLISKSLYSQIQHCQVIKNTLLPITKLILHKVKYPKKLTRLSDLLKSLKDQDSKLIWIDLKQKSNELIEPLKKVILENSSQKTLDSIVVNNTSSELLEKLRNTIPEVRFSLEGKWGSEPLVDSRFVKGVGISHDMISLNVGLRAGDEPIWRLFLKELRFYRRLETLRLRTQQLNIPLIGWTVNNKFKMRKILKYNLDYLLTDNIFPTKRD